jgi:hypothetical protein
MARDTSIEAYRAVEACEFLIDSTRAVYQCLYRDGSLTQNEVWQLIGGKRNKDSYGPRFALLVRLKLIVDLGTRICSYSKKRCHYYDVTSNLPPKTAPKEEKKWQTFWIVFSEKSNSVGYASPDRDDLVSFLNSWLKKARFNDAKIFKATVKLK